MTTFVCAIDESVDQNPRRNYFYGSVAGPLSEWEGNFSDAWNERVLLGPPRIPYLHMTSMRSKNWRAEHQLSSIDANRRLDEASRVIRSCGSLIPIVVGVDEAAYDRILRQPFKPVSATKASLAPDYILFLYVAHRQLHYIHDWHPEATKVDFWAEENGPITRHLRGFHDALTTSLERLGHPELAIMVGEFKVVRKDCIPTQVADMLSWHERNRTNKTLDRDGHTRGWRMVDGGFGTRRRRYGHRGELHEELLRSLADRFDTAGTQG